MEILPQVENNLVEYKRAFILPDVKPSMLA